MDDDGSDLGEVPQLRYLKWLVTGLTVTMIGGFLTIVVLFVMHFSDMSDVTLPGDVVLPEGVRAVAVTQGDGWYAVVTDADEILVYSRVTGGLRQRIQISSE